MTGDRYTVDADDDGLRLDQLLARRAGLSRRRARVLIDIGGVFVDGARCKVASRQVKRGQHIEVHLGGALDRADAGVGRAARERDAAALPPFAVVFEDDHVVVVDKPSGLVTAPTPESDRGNLLDQLSRRGTGPVFLVHRLDLPTSGLLVFARTELANRELSRRFVVHDIERRYLAVAAGRVADDRFTVDRPLRDKRAVTHVTVAERFADASLLHVELETGRSHQIRIHLAGLGHPLLGDHQHGGERSRLFEPKPPRLALHAARLGFVHPKTGEKMRFESDLPAELEGWLAQVRGR